VTSMKRAERRIYENLAAYKRAHSDIYERLAFASDEQIAGWLDTVRNPLQRRYAYQRIRQAQEEIVAVRQGQLDTLPYVHMHPFCLLNGERRSTEDREEDLDVLAPRMGFVEDEEAYA
jgi:hypothetical protein